MSLPQRMTITLSQTVPTPCSAQRPKTGQMMHIFITLHPIPTHDQSTLEVVFTPSWEQEHTSELNIPYTHIESPLNIFLGNVALLFLFSSSEDN